MNDLAADLTPVKPLVRNRPGEEPTFWNGLTASWNDLWSAKGRRRLLERSGYQGAFFHVWLFPITRHGKLLTLAFAITALPASISVDVPIYEVSVGVVCLLLVSTTIGSWFRLVRTSLTGTFPPTVIEGEPLRGEFHLTNRGWWSLYDVGIGCFLPPRVFRPRLKGTGKGAPIQVVLAPGETVSMEVVFETRRRGRYRLPPVRTFTLFPFGIGRNELARTPSRFVTVLPRLAQVRAVATSISAPVSGMADLYRRGLTDPTEYFGSRDYVPGDDLRRVDHRAWSRWGRPVVREFGTQISGGPILLLDFCPPSRLPEDWITVGRNPVPHSVPTALKIARRSLESGLLRLEDWFPIVTRALVRYADEVLESLLSLTGGIVSAWERDRHTAQVWFRSGQPPMMVGLTGEPFEAFWEQLAQLRPTTRRSLPDLVDNLLQARWRYSDDVWLVTGAVDPIVKNAVERMTAEGMRVRILAVSRSRKSDAPANSLIDQETRWLLPSQVREGVVDVT